MHGMILHAPTVDSLKRARRNLVNFRRLQPDSQVVLVANSAAVVHALDHADPETDGFLVLCQNSLNAHDRIAHEHLSTTAAAVVYVHELQCQGWSYWRA